MKDKTSNLIRNLINSSNSIVAVLIAFLIGGFMVLLVGESPINAYSAILKGAFGSPTAIRNTVRFAIQVMLMAYSFSVCNRCGYFNISQEAQLYTSALAMVFVSFWTEGLPGPLRLVLMILAAAAAGALTCLIPAVAKFKLGVNEVVVGVMLNYLTKFICQHLIAFSPIAAKRTSSIVSIEIPEHIPVPVITVSAVLIVIAYAFILRSTIPGHRLTITGKNKQFAQASGIDATKVLLMAAVTGGVLSALCCMGEILGYFHMIYNEFAAGMGTDGMTAAFIGNNTPIGMMFGSLLLGALKSGSVLLSVLTEVPTELIDCVQGLIMFFATIKFFNAAQIDLKRRRVVE